MGFFVFIFRVFWIFMYSWIIVFGVEFSVLVVDVFVLVWVFFILVDVVEGVVCVLMFVFS